MLKKPYVIAEMGVNFYDTAKELNITPLEAAKLYIKEAKAVGIDAAKFQSYKANTIASKNSPSYWDLTKNPITSQYELFKQLDGFNRDDYAELHSYCQELDIDFLSTPFDYASADYLDEFVDIYKISSSDITNLPFIRHIAKKGKPIYLSVGASYLSEVDEAVRAIKEEGNNEICLMHCVLSYPTKNEDANLNIISSLKKIYPDITIGFSDHTVPDPCMTILTAAYLLGAEIIEKHFTLDKTLPGNDHFHSGDPSDFKKAIENFELIQVISGQNEKTVLECEKIPRREARRSLVFTRDMKKGEILTDKDLIAKRPGTGISPKYQSVVLGRVLRKDVKEDEILMWENV
ncbi:MAG: N-acetylneuraminate synthase family protein [Lachnospiraceae bacterium]|nr:N-acetylneuraminate synthase family protein [Lachnospiraceae bacterium]